MNKCITIDLEENEETELEKLKDYFEEHSIVWGYNTDEQEDEEMRMKIKKEVCPVCIDCSGCSECLEDIEDE